MAVLSARTVYAPGREPPKAEIIQLLEQLFNVASGPSVVRQTKAALDLVTPAAETYGGVVLADPTAANNGYYYRSAGAWVKGRGLPDTLAELTVTGGTANAVQASTGSGVNPADVVAFYIDVTMPNTGPVTVSINGAAAIPAYNVNGSEFAPGEWSGRIFLSNEGTSLQALVDPAAAASASASAAAAAQSAADAQAGLGRPFDTLAAAQAYAPSTAPNFIQTAGYSAAGDGGGALYKKVAAEPSNPGKFFITLDDGATVVWYEVLPDADGYFHTLAFGCAGDDDGTTGTDDAAVIQAIADFTPFIHFDAQHFVGSTIQLQSGSRLRGGITPSFTNPGANNRNISWVRSTRAALGDGNPIFRVGAVGSQPQGFVAERLGFFGDLSFDPANIAATPDQGIYGIDVSGLKNGGHFIDCWFRQLRKGVFGDGDPYTDQIVFRGCFWSRNYQMVDCAATAGLSFIGCMAYENVTLVSTTYNAEFISTTIQNSSYSSIDTAIIAKNITWVGGWVEGLNLPFQPTNSAHVRGLWAGEGAVASGSKFLFKIADNVRVIYEGSRIPTNTRFATFLGVSDLSTVSIEVNGAFDGINFGDTSAIGNYLGQIDYRGAGNKNSGDWNYNGPRYRTITGAYTLVRSDACVLIRSTASSNFTLTIPANASVAFPLGTEIHVANPSGAAIITIAITSDTLIHNLGSGSRSLGVRGYAVLKKVSTTTWTLYGQGIT